jgi:hypothetical protein
MPKSTRIPEYRKGGRCYNEKHNPSKKMVKKLWHSYFYFRKFRTLLYGSELYWVVQDIIVSAQPGLDAPETAGQMKTSCDSRGCPGRAVESARTARL